MSIFKYFVALSVLSFSVASYGFGQQGHYLVCELAYQALSTAQQAKLNKLIKQLPAKEKKRIQTYNQYRKGQALSFADTCTWADAVKKDDHYKKYASWHYVNVGRDRVKVAPEDCPEHCVAKAIVIHQQQLKNSKNLWQRQQALMFLGHWLGDIHQPMHVGFASDWGGNKISVISEQSCKNLHWFWDICLLKQAMKQTDKYVKQLQAEYQTLNVSIKQRWRQADAWQWATESLTIVRRPEAKYCQLNSNGICQHNKDEVELAPGYRLHFTPVIEQRILQAATRLAKLLEKSL